jgi:hypothetical protein
MAASVQAGPSLAKLVVSVARLAAIFADATGPKIFFDTLNSLATVIADVLTPIKGLLGVIGGFHAFFVAVAAIVGIASFAFKVLAGNVQKVTKIFTEQNAVSKIAATWNEKVTISTEKLVAAEKAQSMALIKAKEANLAVVTAEKSRFVSEGSSS